MRIAQVATLCTPVRPEHAGSVEALVWLLARELDRLGHEVTVFGAPGSQVPGELVSALPGTYARDGSPSSYQVCEWINLCRAVEESGRFDAIHTHAYLWGIPLDPLAECPMVHTTHVFPHGDGAETWARYPEAKVAAISHEQFRDFPELRPAAVIPHGVDLETHSYRAEPEDYVCWLGRFMPEKGPLEAIAVAREAGMRLLLAGEETPWFRDHVAPEVDGRTVEYAGWLSPGERDRLLGGARALLYPLQVREPFGLVLPEAMACGTPVAAFAIGAVPELVEDGVTGALCPPGGDLAATLGRALGLDRATVAARARERFAAGRMAAGYAELYQRVVRGAAA